MKGEDMSEWISTMDRLPGKELHALQKRYPGENVEVIVMILGAAIPTVLEWDGSAFWDQNGTAYDVTHWMPLPTPPAEEE